MNAVSKIGLIGFLLCTVCIVQATAGTGRQDGAETVLDVAVPKPVAEQVKMQLGEDGRLREGRAFRAPVLILEGVEIGQGESLTFRVLGPASRGAERPVLSVSGMVGSSQATPALPLQSIDLVVPLNQRSLVLLAGKTTLHIVLKVDRNPRRPPLKVKAAHLEIGTEQGTMAK